ncbi:NANA [Hibiscus trionum]|uniref:NANA n=1 Tax=Hibiscus trionum TaxID=183268 RepID=A0A9W7HKP2_HIBTR|nr:NANA [Hibiscus trionum]
MERTISLAFLIWLSWNGCLLFEVNALKAEGKYKLIHRHSPELGDHPNSTLGPPINLRERIRQLVHSDNVRSQTIQQMLGRPGRKISEKTKNLVELSMRSAADLGAGQYFISMRIGTPPKKFLMLVDTGSVLTWIRCKNRCRNCSKEKESPNMRFYHPNKSRTFRSISCSSSFCTSDLIPSNANEICPTPDAPCRYDFQYGDGTRVIGTMGNDTVTIRMRGNKKLKLENVTIGCSEEIISNMEQPLDGLLGLGCERQSFAVKALRQTEKTLSYCLVDYLSPSNVVSYLVFGGVDNHINRLPNMQETDLLLGHWVWSTHYHLNVSGISLDGKMLDIPSNMWLYDPSTRYGGVILDTGSSLTALAAPVYDKLIKVLLPSISKFEKVDYGGPSKVPEHCFNSTGYNETLIPRFAIHFSNGAKFEPPVKNYVIGEDIKCLGFRRFDGLDTSIIGNILQQNFLWEFDLFNEKLKFAPSTCASD